MMPFLSWALESISAPRCRGILRRDLRRLHGQNDSRPVMPGSTVYNRRGQTARFRLSDYEKAQERRAERQRENDAAARRAKGWPETGDKP